MLLLDYESALLVSLQIFWQDSTLLFSNVQKYCRDIHILHLHCINITNKQINAEINPLIVIQSYCTSTNPAGLIYGINEFKSEALIWVLGGRMMERYPESKT